MPAYDLASLHTFRADLYGCFSRRADALFELVDALLAAESVTSLAHLSFQAPHRRGWGSIYDALAEGRLDVDALRTTLAQAPPRAASRSSPSTSVSGPAATPRPVRSEGSTTIRPATRLGNRSSLVGLTNG